MELEQTDGQAAMDSTGTTGAAPEGMGEQSVASVQTTATGTEQTAEESFFDPKDIAGTPLESAYKEMQGAFTKRMQSFSQNKHKLDAYDQFEADPQGTIQQLAQQYGYQLVQPGETDAADFQPQTWDEVMDKAKEAAKAEMMKDLQPLLGEVQNMKQSNMETYMDNKHPDWRTYEDSMLDVLKEHPTLSKSPDLLYDLALPPEVKQARAHKSAMSKIKGQTEASEVSGRSTTTKTPNQNLGEVKTLNDAVAVARQRLAQKGIAAPREY